MELKNKIVLFTLVLVVFSVNLCYGQESEGIDPYYKYEFFINKSPFFISVSMKYIVDETSDYSFYIQDYDYINFHPSQNVKDFSAVSGKSRALITREEMKEDKVEWTVLEVPQESELLINYRIVPLDFYHAKRPFRSFYDGDKGLLFFSTTLMKPVGYRDDSIQIDINSRDVEFHRPFSIGSLKKDLYFSSSIDKLSELVIPIGKWHKIENSSKQSIINLYLDQSIPRSQLNSITRNIKKALSSKEFTEAISSISKDMGILSQFVVFFYDEQEPGIVDKPVLYYNDICFISIAKIGDYAEDLQIILYREVLRQAVKLYLAGMSFKNLTELSPVNSLLTFMSVNSLYNSRVLDKSYFERFRRMAFLKYPYDLSEHEYHDIDQDILDSRIFYLPGIIDNKANMYAKLFYIIQVLDPKLSWNDFLISFIAGYQAGIPHNDSLLNIISDSLPEIDNDTVLNLYNVVREYELDPYKFDN